jgi:glutamine amidotransferase PdxT
LLGNGILRRIFGIICKKVTGVVRKLHEKGLQHVRLLFSRYYYGDQVDEYEIGGEYSTHGEMSNVYKIFIEKPEGKRLCEKR